MHVFLASFSTTIRTTKGQRLMIWGSEVDRTYGVAVVSNAVMSSLIWTALWLQTITAEVYGKCLNARHVFGLVVSWMVLCVQFICSGVFVCSQIISQQQEVRRTISIMFSRWLIHCPWITFRSASRILQVFKKQGHILHKDLHVFLSEKWIFCLLSLLSGKYNRCLHGYRWKCHPWG